jgi:hypothetical protein
MTLGKPDNIGSLCLSVRPSDKKNDKRAAEKCLDLEKRCFEVRVDGDGYVTRHHSVPLLRQVAAGHTPRQASIRT